MVIDSKLIKIAYKKFKSSLYYDKTQTIVRDKLVAFEESCTDIDGYLGELAKDFQNKEKRENLYKEILSSISYYVFPKNLEKQKVDYVTNYEPKSVEVKEEQYFINMDIKGHILGVLWLLLIGYRVDKNIYSHSYGNRIRKSMYDEFDKNPTYSPYLFEPYFQQYESWRDTAMNKAMEHLHTGQDVVVLTMDFKRFYYSVDIQKDLFDRIYTDEVKCTNLDSDDVLSLHDFIFSVIVHYSEKLSEKRNVLPIGFLPSNVLANYALRNFDKAILDGWNPIYFGRYVDDVIIVDKIESSSHMQIKSQKNDLRADEIISYFLEQCSCWNGLDDVQCKKGIDYSLFRKEKLENEDGYEYHLNRMYNPTKNDNSRIIVQEKKLNIFYFKAGESDALISCFKENIAKNKSEFRHMPEDEAIFQRDDYSQIYDLHNEETINKFRGVKSISIDRYELSKLLGKYLRIGGMIHDVKESGFENQIFEILNSRVIIENYNVWEKIIEILTINESWMALKKLVLIITETIENMVYKDDEVLLKIKKTLYQYLGAALARSLALVWGDEVDEFIESLESNFKEEIWAGLVIEHRKAYCNTRMIDKSVMPIFLDMINMEQVYMSEEKLNLCDFKQMILLSKDICDYDYVYYPYLVTMYDYSIALCLEQLQAGREEIGQTEHTYQKQLNKYMKGNYRGDNAKNEGEIIEVHEILDSQAVLVQVNNEKKETLRLAIANVRLKHDNFNRVVLDNPNRSYNRYLDLSKIVNAAIDEKVDMLIMPESYMPFEWLATVARTCAKNQLAVVTGIEHVKIKDCIYNLTAVILPYEDLTHRSAFISFHLKKHYAPGEKQEINGYRLKEMRGRGYELYRWHDCYFPVYCCYELTSIVERAIFQSYADFLVAIEWNKDVNYYSSILESLSRDLHCYCVQVNSSDYGDSRITKPSKTDEKDIIRTKGGKNSTILVDELEIKKIREFQFKGYDLQVYDKSYKPTPPGFDTDVILKKIKGEKLY